IGFETGWMNWIARVTSLASLTNGMVLALSRLFPVVGGGAPRYALIFVILATLAVIHLVGVRYGAASISVFTYGKLVPLIGFLILALIVRPTTAVPPSMPLRGPRTRWNDVGPLLHCLYAGL